MKQGSHSPCWEHPGEAVTEGAEQEFQLEFGRQRGVGHCIPGGVKLVSTGRKQKTRRACSGWFGARR